MSKMSEVMPKWGPYSKKYSGVSRVTEHETEKGVRFDFISLPAVSNTDAKAPNVTIPVGVHPWDVKSDYSFYSYRQDLEWKDVIYSDVSFTKLSDESVLVRTEIFNNSELMQNCLVNYFSSLQFPFLMLLFIRVLYFQNCFNFVIQFIYRPLNNPFYLGHFF